MFFLVRVTVSGDKAIETPLPDYGTFDTGVEASRAAKSASVIVGAKVQPRRMAQAGDWRARAVADLANWPHELPKGWDLHPIVDHYLRVAGSSRSSNGMLSYFASETDSIINKLTTQSPGRYIGQFYPDLPQEVAKRYIAMIDPAGTLMFARTAEEASTVYDDGPDSCMKGEKGRYTPPSEDDDDNAVHVCRMYGTGDLAVAYLHDSRGRITARSVCYPAKKQFGRLYGDQHRLAQKLADEGFVKVTFLEGARVEPASDMVDGELRLALPYFDNIVGIAVEDDGTYRTMRINEKPRRKINGGQDCGFYGIIEERCDATGHYFTPSLMADAIKVDGSISRVCVDDNGTRNSFVCAATGVRYRLEVPHTRMNGGFYWTKVHFEQHGATCRFNGNNYPKTEMIKARDGALVSKGAVNAYHRMLDRQDELQPRYQITHEEHLDDAA